MNKHKDEQQDHVVNKPILEQHQDSGVIRLSQEQYNKKMQKNQQKKKNQEKK